MDLTSLSQTPLPTIFVVAGILFWILAIAGSVAGKITIEPGMRLTAQLAGTAFVLVGVVLFFASGPANQSTTEAASKPMTASPASVGAATPPAPAPTTAPPAPPPTSPVGERTTELSPPAKSQPMHTRPSPGVNCTGSGSPDEVVICANAKLIDLDWQLYDLYHQTLSEVDKAQQAKLAHDEGVWVTQRSACKSDASCLIDAYKLRIAQLNAAH